MPIVYSVDRYAALQEEYARTGPPPPGTHEVVRGWISEVGLRQDGRVVFATLAQDGAPRDRDGFVMGPEVEFRRGALDAMLQWRGQLIDVEVGWIGDDAKPWVVGAWRVAVDPR